MDLTPNREQILWTAMNSLMDDGINIEAEDIEGVPDHYIYELSQHMPMDELAKKYRNVTIADIQQIVKRHIDRTFEFEEYMRASEADLREKQNNPDEV